MVNKITQERWISCPPLLFLGADGTAEGVFSECEIKNAGGSVRNDADHYVSVGCSCYTNSD